MQKKCKNVYLIHVFNMKSIIANIIIMIAILMVFCMIIVEWKISLSILFIVSVFLLAKSFWKNGVIETFKNLMK